MSPSLMNIRLYTVFKNLQDFFSIDLRHIKYTINHCKERGKKSSQTGGYVLKTSDNKQISDRLHKMLSFKAGGLIMQWLSQAVSTVLF